MRPGSAQEVLSTVPDPHVTGLGMASLSQVTGDQEQKVRVGGQRRLCVVMHARALSPRKAT